MTPPEPTDEQLAAWLAGDLDDPEDAAVTQAVEADPAVAARADALSEALLRLDVGVTDPPAAGFDARLDAALAARLGPDLLSGPIAARAAPPQVDPQRLPAADRPPRARAGGRRPRPVWGGPASRTAHPGQRRIDRLVPGLAALLLLTVVTTVGIRSFRDGPLPAIQPTADEQTDPLGTDEPPTEIPLAAADPSDPSDADPARTAPPEDPPAQPTGPASGSAGGGSPGAADDDPGSAVALGGGAGPGADDSGADDPPADDTTAGDPTTDDPAAGDAPAADQPGAATDGGTPAPEPSPTGDGAGPDQGTDGQGGGPDGGADGGSGEEVAAGDQPPPEGQPESQPAGGAAADQPAAGEPESAPEDQSASSPTIADSQVALPGPAAVDQHFGHRQETAAVMGLSGQEAADRAQQHAQQVREAPPFQSGEVPDRCLDVALQGSSTAVVVAVETVTYDGQPGLAYLVVRGDPLDRADVTIVPSGSCDPLLVRSVPT